MHPSVHAKTNPDRAAIIMGNSGETITYAELEARSNKMAHLFRSMGLQHGDAIGLCMDNRPEFFYVAWGAQRAGLYFVGISSRLTAPEINYILEDSGAKALFACDYLGEALDGITDNVQKFTADGERAGWASLADAVADMPDTPIADERAGMDMLYSSGTTGKPKGIRIPLPEDPAIAAPSSFIMLVNGAFGIQPDCVYLTPAPMYHAAPLRWTMCIHRLGGTTVIMEKFDPENALALIEKYKITDGQFVPTHFVRMLKLPEETRGKYDVSTMKCAVHAAAPCPVPIKQAMIEWWGPALKEYYAGTEGQGLTFITSEEWLEHKGSVGRAVIGTLHICDEDGNEVEPRTEGGVYFESDTKFVYHNDEKKTAEAANRHGWTTLGDVGWQDEEGFLYLTDRKSFMIISGGVNVYPQEIENLLITHDKVADAAVIGAPDDDLGERVVAVVQPLDTASAGDALAGELHDFLRETLSGVKVPKQIDFRDELPRHATGKLYKRLLRDEYWGKKDSKIVA